MANFNLDSNPMEIEVDEPGKLTVPSSPKQEIAILVTAGTLQFNTKGPDMSNSPDYTPESGRFILTVDDGDLHFDGTGTFNAEV